MILKRIQPTDNNLESRLEEGEKETEIREENKRFPCQKKFKLHDKLLCTDFSDLSQTQRRSCSTEMKSTSPLSPHLSSSDRHCRHVSQRLELNR